MPGFVQLDIFGGEEDVAELEARYRGAEPSATPVVEADCRPTSGGSKGRVSLRKDPSEGGLSGDQDW